MSLWTCKTLHLSHFICENRWKYWPFMWTVGFNVQHCIQWDLGKWPHWSEENTCPEALGAPWRQCNAAVKSVGCRCRLPHLANKSTGPPVKFESLENSTIFSIRCPCHTYMHIYIYVCMYTYMYIMCIYMYVCACALFIRNSDLFGHHTFGLAVLSLE